MTLIIIYNANSGKTNAILDVAHKWISPGTYNCRLCSLTYGTFSEKQAWKEFRKTSSVAMEFYHKDEFESAFRTQEFSYPVVLLSENNKLTTFIPKEELNAIKTLDELIQLIEKRLANLSP
ncbi:MAG: GTPase [Bacteroidia bacterium]|nr:GTPase [Bacteroidia bacterium]MBT8268731.1 GTPase [Bacteroidia bacterium]NNF81567.1 GTPase [Flavobacteriaceae bacterium]NNK69729.1 GTPase [Flavobacteriaceae bacterium]NNL81262.1 GTPase [Flavobacteriaceae bacterium]